MLFLLRATDAALPRRLQAARRARRISSQPPCRIGHYLRRPAALATVHAQAPFRRPMVLHL
eukprot:363704-Pyramimonas_sp.AAC.1